MNNLINEARRLCEASSKENAYTEPVYGSAVFWLITDTVPALCVALEKAEAANEKLTNEVGRLIDLSGSWKEAADQYHAERNRLQAANRWIPVGERLPEDDKPVWAFGHIVHGACTAMFKGRWIAAHTMRSGDFGADDDMSLEYDEAEDEFYVPEGWFERIENWDDFTDIAVGDYIVTHWRPLPEPPKGE